MNLSPLLSLTHLELTACDLSTSAWLGLESVRGTLRSLSCRNSLEELWHLLAPASGRARTPSMAPLRAKQDSQCAKNINLSSMARRSGDGPLASSRSVKLVGHCDRHYTGRALDIQVVVTLLMSRRMDF